MSSEVLKKFYSEGDEYDIINLLKLCFDEWKRNKDPLNYWKWKWIDAPGGFNIIVSKQNEKIVAVTHIIYLENKIGDSILKTSYSDDLATHPDFRGKGLYKELRDLIDNEEPKKGSKIIFSVNTNPITIKTNLKRGRSILPHKIEHMVLINNPSLHFKKINIKYNFLYSTSFKFLKLLNNLSNIFKSVKYGNNNAYQIKQITNFDNKYDIFWDNIKKDYLIISVKNSRFLNWRYSDKRGGDYRIYEIFEKNNVLGFTVLEIRDNNGYKTGYILELLSLKNREDVINAVIQHLKNEMLKLDINILNLLTTNKKMIKLLEQFGFIKMPFTKELKAMYKFIDSDTEKQIFLTAQPDEIYWGYGNYFL
jgi:N-acetylglutamate synthase-like GNAT family acetyltransferase